MTEHQPFELVRRYADFELRRYPAHTVAEMEVTSSFDGAGNAAFRRLFNYIRGNNTARQTLAMTAPVLQRGALDSGPSGGSAQAAYVVAFVLPAGMSEDAAPVPADPRVRIRTVPGSTAAALRFSGRGSGSAFAMRNHELQGSIAAAGLKAIGPPRFARFDPPFKPWFLRRNEVVQDVVQGQDPDLPAES
ncbi:heme-binding protein [Arthrobacter sp. I2-34]|uniref:Heme-binding protein n=1 Tax=Arthrobacter hankyongi TaxID=2904801 RepID=A0ABS9L175_9MICC|nr:heme-binding protein [Arthrobacter hankyongi]MCG2620328.1 heme-binding protein [Arthrobacter hankyongi]